MPEGRCLKEKDCPAKKILFQLRDIENSTLRLTQENGDWFDPDKMDVLDEVIGLLQETRLGLISEVSKRGCTEIKHWPIMRVEDPCEECQSEECKCCQEVTGHC